MEKLLMCRICFIKDVRLHCLVNTHLQEIYELLSGNLLETKDTRPLHACYMCCARLGNCLRLRNACLHSEELFSRHLENDTFVLTPSQGMNMLQTTPVMNMDLSPVVQRKLKMEPSPMTDEQRNEEQVGDLQDDIIDQGISSQFIKEDMKFENISLEDQRLDYSIQSIKVESNSASDNSCVDDSQESYISNSNYGISSVDLQDIHGKNVKIVSQQMDSNSIQKAEQELEKMCEKSKTETEEYSSYITEQTDKLFEEIIQECIVDENIRTIDERVKEIEIQKNVHWQPIDTRDLDSAVIVLQPPALKTDSNVQQNVTTEVQLDNSSLTLTVLAKIETLQENYKALNEKITENMKAQQDDRKFISESVQSILLGLSNISVQFEQMMNPLNHAVDNKQKENIQKIASEKDLNSFEKLLENPDAEVELKKRFSIICGKGKGRGVNNAYALVDAMFTRSFLPQCSWAGGSRSSEQKICFKSHTKIINLFFDIIHDSDSSYTLLECHKFFKNILKNSRQRNESKQERTSRTKNRPVIKAQRKKLSNEEQLSLPSTSAQENCSEPSLSNTKIQ